MVVDARLPSSTFAVRHALPLDGLLGLATGSGYLDLVIFQHGVLDLAVPSAGPDESPHIAIGGLRRAFAGFVLARGWRAPQGRR